MSKKITAIVVFLIAILAVVIGTITFISQKASQTDGLTSEDAQTINIDVSNWKTYKSEDGVLTLNYPAEFEDVFPVINVIERPSYLYDLNVSQEADIGGVFSSSDFISGDVSANVSQDGSSRLFVIVFDEGVAKLDVVSLLETNAVNQEIKTLLIGEYEFELIRATSSSVLNRETYVTEINDRIVLVQSLLASYGSEELERAVSQGILEEILKSIRIR